ncbi:MAG TPA: DUF4113 domain-containing protein [Hyphomonadaceae bacterium]|nr:DUF4113 domain-containing protein [Hyphomonadaceae bacterium]
MDRPRHTAGQSASRGFLPGLLGLRGRRSRLALRLGLAACQDFDVAESRHDKLGRIAGVATLIVPLVLADLPGDAQARIRDALRAGRRMWRPGFRYAKAGVVLLDLTRLSDQSDDLFPTADTERRGRLMVAMDAVNLRYGSRALKPACVAATHGWSMRRQKLSPRYTTYFDEMLSVAA